MKKINALMLLPLIALASCSKQEPKIEETTTSTDTTNTQVVPTEETTSTGEALNQNITSTTTDSTTSETEKSFEFIYEIGGNKVPVKGKFILENGKVKDMIIDGAVKDGQSPLDSFAKNAPAQVIGKELKGLKIDTVSGASYVTVGFNQFLSTLN